MKLLITITFLLLTLNYTIAGSDWANNFTLGKGIASGNDITLQFGSGNGYACIKYDGTSGTLQSSNDCSSFTSLGQHPGIDISSQNGNAPLIHIGE